MKDSQLLSAYVDSQHADPEQVKPGRVRAAARSTSERAAVLYVFDACHPGVVLRALLGVAAILAIGALFAAPRWGQWLLVYPVWIACVTPGLLLWLVVCCGAKRWLADQHNSVQWSLGIALGAACGLLSLWAATLLGQSDGLLGHWLAGAGAGGLVAAALVAALMWRAKAQMPAATAARLAELQSRIRPHFLFNALNSAISLVRDEPHKAERVLEDLSDVFRQALTQSQAHVSLAEELEVARAYLDVEQIRFGDRMHVEWTLDPSAHTARVPPLILQPLVENAVKHGVEHQTSPTHIKISTQRRGGRVVVRVTNTLPQTQRAEPAREHHGIALANVKERLTLLHDVNASFRAEASSGMFQARMEFPAP